MSELRDIRKKGWFWIENNLIDREDIGAYEKLIYMALSRFADSNGKCFPGLDFLMKKCNIGNKSTLRKYLAVLEEKGLIEIEKRNGKGNIYYLKNVKSEPGTDLTMVESVQTPCPNLYRHPVQICTPKETQEKNTIKKTQLYLYKSEEFQKAFFDFKLMRKKINSELSQPAEELILMNLVKLSNNDEELAIRILQQSIINNWKNIFPLKEEKQQYKTKEYSKPYQQPKDPNKFTGVTQENIEKLIGGLVE